MRIILRYVAGSAAIRARQLLLDSLVNYSGHGGDGFAGNADQLTGFMDSKR